MRYAGREISKVGEWESGGVGRARNNLELVDKSAEYETRTGDIDARKGEIDRVPELFRYFRWRGFRSEPAGSLWDYFLNGAIVATGRRRVVGQRKRDSRDDWIREIISFHPI